MSLKDLFITPVYIFILFQVLNMIKKKENCNVLLKKYFIPAAAAKIFGAVALGVVYYFYYRGGDTIQYYKGITIVNEIFSENPLLGLKAIFRNCNDSIPEDLMKYLWHYSYIKDNGSFFIVRIGSIISFFTFNTYTLIAIMFGMFSFSGSWAFFRVMVSLYPQIHKELANAIFFLPSVIFWGSGLMKDSLTFGALCWIIYGFYHLILVKDNFLKSIIMTAIGIVILVTVKIYILMSLIPALVVWFFLIFNQRIKSKITRLLILPFMILISLGLGMFATTQIAEQDQQYKLDNLTQKAKITNEWLSYMSKLENGSYYDLGILDYSPMGLLKIFPKAVNVTLFRPYLWEARNPVMLMSAFESLFFLCFTIYTIFKVGFMNTLSIARNNPVVISFLIFSFGMSFAVGITSANFGTLVRYKIPVMPFYISSFFIIAHIFKMEKLKLRNQRIFNQKL